MHGGEGAKSPGASVPPGPQGAPGVRAEAAGSTTEARFGPREVLASAWATWGAHRRRIAGVAVVVYGTVVASEVLVRVLVPWEGASLHAALTLAVTIEDVFGLAVFVGLMVALVGSSRYGLPERSTTAILGHMPWGRLVAADVVATVLVAVATLALVVPGMVVLTLVCLVGPVIEIERPGVLGALRRSAALARRRFWLLATLVTFPLFVGGAVLGLVADLAKGVSPLAAFVLASLFDAALSVATGLIVVEVAWRLVGPRAGQAAPASS